jgi:hypothetical protein
MSIQDGAALRAGWPFSPFPCFPLQNIKDRARRAPHSLHITTVLWECKYKKQKASKDELAAKEPRELKENEGREMRGREEWGEGFALLFP